MSSWRYSLARRWALAVILSLLAGPAPLIAGPDKRPAKKVKVEDEKDRLERQRLFQEFSDRVARYVELQRRLKAELPTLKDKTSAEKILAHHQALAEKLRAARADAQPGDIFFHDVSEVFEKIIREDLRSPAARNTIREGNPEVEGPRQKAGERIKKVPLIINASYPLGAPLSTVPPSLLLKLPVLPEEVRYRFVGRHLILRDSEADIVVDYVKDAIPKHVPLY